MFLEYRMDEETFNSSLKDTLTVLQPGARTTVLFQFLIKGYPSSDRGTVFQVIDTFNSSLKDTSALIMVFNALLNIFQFLIKGYLKNTKRVCE